MKIYADEDGSEYVPAVSDLVVSLLARVEVPSALWRKHRLGEISLADVARLLGAFEVDFDTGFRVVGLPLAVIEHAARLVATHQLKGYDAMQLASALSARAADPWCDHFVCFDHSLRAAAAAEGLALVPPELTTGPGG